MNDDTLYIEQFLAGDTAGFEALVRKYQNRVLNIVYSLVGQNSESEDIAQEVFLKIYHGLQSFRQNCQFSTWLYRITVNTTYDFLRRRKNFIHDEGILEYQEAETANPQEVVVNQEKDAMIQKALMAIPTIYRSAVVLKDIEGMNYKEIAKVLGCRIGTVESRIYRARQLLKEKLETRQGEFR